MPPTATGHVEKEKDRSSLPAQPRSRNIEVPGTSSPIRLRCSQPAAEGT